MGSEEAPLVGLLGPITVWDDGREAYVGPARQREVLAVLALRRGQLVSAREIAANVWGDRQPDSAKGLVHTYTGRLRAMLNCGSTPVLESRRPGYRLAIDPRDVDVTRFEELVQQGRSEIDRSDLAAATGSFAAALRLWRGEAMAGAIGPLARLERRRLTELWHEASEEQVRARMLLGDPRGVVPELMRMIGKDPLRERLWALLMVVLAKMSRTAEAVTAYHEARTTLRDRLGVEPGRELQELYRRLLHGEVIEGNSAW